jgi:hypothetical protein
MEDLPAVGHRSRAKANNPYWSNYVATWQAGHQRVEKYCRRRDISMTFPKRWARHPLSSEDLHKRKKRLQNLRTEQLERQGKRARPGRIASRRMLSPCCPIVHNRDATEMKR